MTVPLLTLDDFDLEDKAVLLRADINSPLDPRSGDILDTSRIEGYLPTLNRLMHSKVVILAHQSRPGKSDFTTLERHALALSKLVKGRVYYVDAVFGSSVKQGISKMKNGEVLVLENVRFCSEEISKDITKRPPSEQAKTHLVRKLSSSVDHFVNDAFAVSHRSQPSVVGFPLVLPSCVGPTMEREIKVLSKVLHSKESPKVFSIGGAKADDSIRITKNILKRDIAGKVLLSGLAAIIFLVAQGKDVGETNKRLIAEQGYERLIKESKALLSSYGDRIMLPLDLALEEKGRRVEAPVDGFPNSRALDIGEKTISSFSKEIKDAKIVIAKGPAGVFEMNGFGRGTEALLEAMADSGATTVIGGGHLTTVAGARGIKDRFSHIASGGGATVSFLSDQPLPGIEAIRKAAQET